MNRRNLSGFLPNTSSPPLNGGAVAESEDSPGLVEMLGLTPIAAEVFSVPEPDHPDHWMNAPRFPVWDPECPLALIFVLAIHNNHPCTFRYHGGSMPGAKRTVYPAQVFTVGNSDNLYLAGWCMNTEAHRIFRIDRTQMVV